MSSNDERMLRKLFVDKLTRDISESDIERAFSCHGPIEEVAKYQDRGESGRYYAFVVYRNAADCLKATKTPQPIVKGKRVVCMLAAIGKMYSGYEFFLKRGFLTDDNAKKEQIRKTKKNHNNNRKNKKYNKHNNGGNTNPKNNRKNKNNNNGNINHFNRNGNNKRNNNNNRHINSNNSNNIGSINNKNTPLTIFPGQQPNLIMMDNNSYSNQSYIKDDIIDSPPIQLAHTVHYSLSSQNDSNFPDIPQMAPQMIQSNNENNVRSMNMYGNYLQRRAYSSQHNPLRGQRPIANNNNNNGNNNSNIHQSRHQANGHHVPMLKRRSQSDKFVLQQSYQKRYSNYKPSFYPNHSCMQPNIKVRPHNNILNTNNTREKNIPRMCTSLSYNNPQIRQNPNNIGRNNHNGYGQPKPNFKSHQSANIVRYEHKQHNNNNHNNSHNNNNNYSPPMFIQKASYKAPVKMSTVQSCPIPVEKQYPLLLTNKPAMYSHINNKKYNNNNSNNNDVVNHKLNMNPVKSEIITTKYGAVFSNSKTNLLKKNGSHSNFNKSTSNVNNSKSTSMEEPIPSFGHLHELQLTPSPPPPINMENANANIIEETTEIHVASDENACDGSFEFLGYDDEDE